MTLSKLVNRVTNLERKVKQLAQKVDNSPADGLNAWIGEIHGTFQDDATYRQAARLGRKWRKGHRGKKST